MKRLLFIPKSSKKDEKIGMEIGDCVQTFLETDTTPSNEAMGIDLVGKQLENICLALKAMSELLTDEQKEDLARKLNFERSYNYERTSHDED